MMESGPSTPPGPGQGRVARRAPFSLRARANSFAYAFRGIWTLLRHEHNAWIHLGFAVAVCSAGAWSQIDRVEWALVAFAIGSVFAAEAFNSAVETLADAVKPGHDPLVGQAKDLAAAAVLLASIAAAVVGLLIFGPLAWAQFAGWVHSSPSK